MKLKNLGSGLSATFFSIGGQGLFLLGNLLVFYTILRNFSAYDMGLWAIFLALVSLLDGIRQGLIQNPFTRLLLVNPKKEKEILGSALVLHFTFIFGSSVLLFGLGALLDKFWNMPDLAALLRLSFLPLLGLGTIQGLASLAIAKGKLSVYFWLNLIYGLVLGICLALFVWQGNTTFSSILIAQGAVGFLLVFFAVKAKLLAVASPKKSWIREIVQTGKYAAGTNLCSLLFQKVDIFMIGYFLNPTAVGIFQLATKIIQYVELPLSAFGQVIYPRLAATQRPGETSRLNSEYARGILTLFALIVPGVLMVLLFGDAMVQLLGNEEYADASTILMILIPASLLKPWGRVFGLALDSVGLSQVNFQMLLFSLAVNVLLNTMLIQVYGLEGAALATSLSTILTIILGQIRLKKYLEVKVGWGMLQTIRKEILPSLKY